jgi:hypothetical protein
MGDYFDMESDENGAHLAWANTFNGEQDVYYSYITPPGTGLNEHQRDYRMCYLSCYPNPFINFTTVRYKTPADCFVEVTLFNIFGKEIKTLIKEKQPAGKHSVVLQADDLHNGYYFCRIQADDCAETIGMIRMNK